MRASLRTAGAAASMAFVVVVALRHPGPRSDAPARLPERARLTDVVRAEEQRVQRLRGVVAGLRTRVDALGRPAPRPSDDVAGDLEAIRQLSGLTPVEGPGLVVRLDDGRVSTETRASVNVNDLVIHSQDVQAVANGLWSAGAEAVAVNGERVMPTSALLCVGNTLLVNGTVHSPPYVFEAIGSPDRLRQRFLDHDLVRRFAADARRFDLGFDVETSDHLTVPGFRGSISLRYARRG